MRRLSCALLATPLIACAARTTTAANPYTADQIERLLRGAVPATKVLADARRECIAFQVTDTQTAAFIRAGAPAWFADSLGSACRVAAGNSSGGGVR